jgi:c-di-GMP-binding flagellar brake protein YcgR
MSCYVLAILVAASAEFRSAQDPEGKVVLPEPNVGLLGLICIVAVFLILALLGLSAVKAQKRNRLRRAREKEKLDAFLSQRGLTSAERTLLEDIAQAGEEPLARVVKLVLSFDHGVDSYLKSLPPAPGDEHLLMLRRLKTLRFKLALDRVPPGVALVSTREISLGQVFLLRSSADPERQIFAGILMDADDAGLLVRLKAGPSPEAEPSLPLSDPAAAFGEKEANSRLEVYFLRRDDGGYRFSARLKAVLRGEEVLLQLSHPRRLLREQRRDYFRVPLRQEIAFRRVGAEILDDPMAAASLSSLSLDQPGTIADLSGGGFRLVAAATHLGVDDLIAVRLPFMEESLDQKVLVARVIKVYREGAEFGLSFETLSPADRSAIVRYVEEVHRLVQFAM